MKKILSVLCLISLFFLTSCEKKPEHPPETKIPDSPAVQKPEPPSDVQKIKWYGYEEGISLGKSLDKKILLTFYADWCRYCVEMDLKTFLNRDIVSYLNEHFISIRVDSEKEVKTASLYQVRGIPVTWFIEENGENIGSQPGYIAPETLLPILKYIHTDSYKKMKFTDFLKIM